MGMMLIFFYIDHDKIGEMEEVGASPSNSSQELAERVLFTLNGVVSGQRECPITYCLSIHLSLTLHGGGTGNWPQKDLIGNSLRTWSEMYGLVHPVRATMTVGNMIMTGVFDKYPDLQMAIIEGGSNWVPSSPID